MIICYLLIKLTKTCKENMFLTKVIKNKSEYKLFWNTPSNLLIQRFDPIIKIIEGREG